jgi:hypothetical protein
MATPISVRSISKWIGSFGGPLICVESEHRNKWRGADRARLTQDNVEDDYQLACDVAGYAGVISLRGFLALILGGMPLQTAVFSDNEGKKLITRVVYAENDEDIYNGLLCLGHEFFDDCEEIAHLSVRSGSLSIFDSAQDGEDDDFPVIDFELCPGSYEVVTKVYNPDDRTELVLHKFVLCD